MPSTARRKKRPAASVASVTSAAPPRPRGAAGGRAAPEDDRLDRVFHALADRTRRAMLARLEQAPANITELAAPFAMSLPAVSKHLRVLEAAGLATRLVDGRVHCCSFEPAPLREVDAWLAHYRGFWGETLDALAEFVREPAPAGAEAEERS
jgi:DNA-binding transcriptional ArsR family regulator